MDSLIRESYGYDYLLKILNNSSELELVYQNAINSKDGISNVSPEYQNIQSMIDYYIAEMIKSGEIKKYPTVLQNYINVFNKTLNIDKTYIFRNDVANLSYQEIQSVMNYDTYQKIEQRKQQIEDYCKNLFEKFRNNTITDDERKFLIKYLRDNINTNNKEIYDIQEEMCKSIINNKGNYGYIEADFIVGFIGNEECKKYEITGMCHLSEYTNSTTRKFNPGTRGIASFGTISVAKEYGINAINNKGNDLAMFIHTICHEVRHLEQKSNIKNKVSNEETMEILYDKIFRKYLQNEEYNYYMQNYYFESGELDAELTGYIESINYLNKYGYKVSQEIDDEMFKLKDKQIYKKMVDMRKDQNGNKISASLFKHKSMKLLIMKKPELLKEYPELQHVYNPDGSIKSFEELLLESANFTKKTKRDNKDIFNMEFNNAIDLNQLDNINYGNLSQENLFKIMHELSCLYNNYASQAHNFLQSHRQSNNFLYEERLPEHNQQFIAELKERTKLMASRYKKLETVLDTFYKHYGEILQQYEEYKYDQFIYNKDKQYARMQFGKIKELYYKNHKSDKNSILVDEMINKMVEGTLDVNGNAINSNTPDFDNRKKGFTGIQLLTVTSFIASFIISLIGIIFIFITK